MLEPLYPKTWARPDRRAWSLTLSLLLLSGILAWVAGFLGDGWTYKTGVEYVPREISIRAYEIASDLVEFSLGLPNYAFGTYITLEAIRPETSLYLPLIILSLAALSLVAAATSYLEGFTLYGTLALLAGGVILFAPDGLSTGGHSAWLVPVSVLSVIGPVYGISAWFSSWNMARRWLVLGLLFACLGFLLFPDPTTATGGARWMTALIFPVMASALLFMVWNAGDVLQGMVYLLTKEENNTQSALHFTIFSILYLSHFLLIFLKNTGQLVLDIFYPSPFFLQTLTLILGFWALEKKSGLLGLDEPRNPATHSLFAGLGSLFFLAMAMGFGLGNDLIVEALEDAICLLHFGMGCSFFLYVAINFFQLMGLGLKVHLVVFKPRYMPTSAIPVFGIAGALIFLLNRDFFAWYQTLGAKDIFLADVAAMEGNTTLQESLLLQARSFDPGATRTNLNLASFYYAAGQAGKGQEYAENAGIRRPTPVAHVAIAQHYHQKNLPLFEILALQEGLRKYPGEGRLLNNLGMAFTQTIYKDSAHYYFSRAAESSEAATEGKANLGFFYLSQKLERDGLPKKTAESDAFGNWGHLNNQLVFANAAGEKAPFLSDIQKKFSEIPDELKAYLLYHAYLNKAITRDSTELSQLQKLESDSLRSGYQEALDMGKALVRYRTGLTKTGLSELNGLQEAASQHRLDLTLLLGQLFYDQGAFSTAAGYFRKAARMGMAPANYWFALACLDAGRKDQALEAFMEALPYLNANDKIRVTVMMDGLRSGQFHNAAQRSDMEKSAYLKTQFGNLNDQQVQDLIYLVGDKESQRFLWKYAFDRSYQENREERCRKLYKLGQLLIGKTEKGKRLLASTRPDYLEITRQWKALEALKAEGGLANFPFAEARLLLSKSDLPGSRLKLKEALETNPLNNRQTGTALEYLASLPNEKEYAYNMALELSNLDPQNPEYLKRYALIALRQGLDDFALGVLPRYEVLTNKAEAQSLKSRMEAEIAAKYQSPVLP